MADKVRIGIIGTGSISQVHIDAYLKNPAVEIVGLCDINEERVKSVGARIGVDNCFTNADDLLKLELDGVSICTWNNSHAELSIKALEAGCHVLCEKPAAMNAAQATQMQEAARRTGKFLQIGFVRRFSSHVEMFKYFQEQGLMGELYYANAKCVRRCGNPGGWFADKSRSGGGPLIDLGVHMVDLAWYLAGKPEPLAVSAVTFDRIGMRKNIKGYDWYRSADQDMDISTVEDQAVALIRFAGGFTLNLDVSFDLHIKHDVLEANFYGNRGGFALFPKAEFFTGFGPYLMDLEPKVKGEDFGGMFQREINHFVNCIQGKEECISTIDDGLVVMRILDAVYASAEKGKEVPV